MEKSRTEAKPDRQGDFKGRKEGRSQELREVLWESSLHHLAH